MSIAQFLNDHGVANLDPSPTQTFAPLAKGNYALEITRLEWKESRTGGVLLSIGTKTPGGRWVWANINVVNASPRAQEIGQQLYSQLLFALETDSQTMIDNAAQFEGRTVEGYVSIDKDNENTIRSFATFTGPAASAEHQAPLSVVPTTAPKTFNDISDDNIPF